MTSSRIFSDGHVDLEVQRFDRTERTGYKIINTRNILEAEEPYFITKTTSGKVVGVRSERWGFADAMYDWYPTSHFREWLIFYGWYYNYVLVRGQKMRRIHIKQIRPLNTGASYLYTFVKINGKKRAMSHDEILTSMICRTQDRIFKIDQEFCESEKVVQPIHPKYWEIPNNDTDDRVYRRFRQYMNLKKNPQSEISFSGVPTGLMHDVKMTQIGKIYDGMKRKKFVPWWDIDGGISYGVVYKRPKKDGELRRVFPMSQKLNAFITQEYGQQTYILPKNVKEVRGCRFRRMRYSYDIKNCDVLLLPYFRRLLREKYPEDEGYLLANVKYMGGFYELPQFPSGICIFMKYASMCFTAAYLGLENYDCEFQIQGDGVFSEVELDTFGLEVHREIDHVINGFYYDLNDLPHYVNADKRLTTPQILGVTKIRGELLWKFRREIYIRFLRGAVTVKHHLDELGDVYAGVSDEKLLEMARDNCVQLEKICDVLEAHKEKDKLELAKRYLREQEYWNFNKTLVWDANPSVGHLG